MLKLGKKSKTAVGLEFTGELLRTVMLEGDGEALRLVAYGTTEFDQQQVSEGEVLEEDHVADEVSSLFRELKMDRRHVATSISGRAVIVKRIQMDSMTEELARDTIQFEVGDHIPFDINDVCLDFQILRQELPGNKMEVLLVAARKEVVESRRDLLAAAGVGLTAIDVDAFAIQRAYEVNYEPDPEHTAVLIHVGDLVTSINVVREGSTLFVRDLPLATRSLVESLQQRLGLSRDEARRILLEPENTPAPEAAEAIQAGAEALSLEIERSFSYMRASHEVAPLDQIVLSGEGARVPILVQHLSDYLRLPVEVADPLRRIEVDPAVFAGGDPQILAPSLMIAVGLALRGRN